MKFLYRNFFSPVFLYHAAFSKTPDSLGNAVHNVQPENIYKQIAWLKKYYDIVDVDDLFAEPYKAGCCAITFDDAYKSVFTGALPALEAHNAPATVFVNGTTLKGKIFWRDKIRLILNSDLTKDFIIWAKEFCETNHITEENFYFSTKKPSVNSKDLSVKLDQFLENYPDVRCKVKNFCIDNNFEWPQSSFIKYGNHTYNHYVLSSLSIEEQKSEILENRDLLSGLVGEHSLSRVFSIPFGGLDTFNEDTIKILKEAGYIGALLSRSRFNKANIKKLPQVHGFPVLERLMPPDDISAFNRYLFKTALRTLKN